LVRHFATSSATSWPAADLALAKEDEITLVVQINGKLRAKLTLPADVDEATAVATALAAPEIVEWLQGVPPAKTIYVPGRLVNLVQNA
jgi:leucyl-tRNA synthetase